MRLLCLALLALSLHGRVARSAGARSPSLRALPEDLPLAVRFIKEALPKEGVNVLVLEINYRFQFTKRPEMADPAGLTAEQVKAIAEACRSAGVRFNPGINLLGHQSWAKNTGALLRVHPEFDETPGRSPQNEGIYCRSYCPLHPQVHAVVFDLIDELADAAGADAFHVGMDEVFLLGEDDCSRCKGKDKAELFAQEVRTVYDHLALSKRTMWMWGDRFLGRRQNRHRQMGGEHHQDPSRHRPRPQRHRHQRLALRARSPHHGVLRGAGLPGPGRAMAQARCRSCPARRDPPRTVSRDRGHRVADAGRPPDHLGRLRALCPRLLRRSSVDNARSSTEALEALATFRALFRELRAMDAR